jgi:hypothetical protein
MQISAKGPCRLEAKRHERIRQPTGALRSLFESANGEITAASSRLSAGACSNSMQMAALRWLRRVINISPSFFHRTENLCCLRAGLDYSTDPARRAALERARDNDLVTALHTKLHEAKDGIRPLGAGLRAGLCEGNVARHDRRPAAQSGWLYRWDVQSAAIASVDSYHDGDSRRRHECLPARCQTGRSIHS